MDTKGLCMLRPCFTGGVSVWSSNCPTLCLTVSDVSELPDPATGCEFALVRLVESDVFQLVIYQWVVDTWVLQAGVGGVIASGEISSVDYDSGTYAITIDGNTVSGTGTQVISPAVTSLDVTFTNGACSYVMEAVEATTPLAFTYFMNRDLATNDEVTMNVDFSAISQTGYIDWGDGSALELFDTGAGTSLVTSHVFANSGFSDIKFYTTNLDIMTVVIMNSLGGTGKTGGIDISFEAGVTNLQTLMAVNSNILILPTFPISVAGVAFANNLLTSIDLTPYTNLVVVGLQVNDITSIDITGLVLQELDLSFNVNLSSITGIDFTNLILMGIGSCAFSTATIEGYLDGLDANTLSFGQFDSIGQTPTAPIDPGYAAYLSLLGKNWTVNFD